MDTRESSAPLLGLFSIICKHVYLYIQQISGERLQDHWSSGSSPSSTLNVVIVVGVLDSGTMVGGSNPSGTKYP